MFMLPICRFAFPVVALAFAIMALLVPSQYVLAQGVHGAASSIQPQTDESSFEVPSPPTGPFFFLPRLPVPPQGLIIEMSLAPPVDIPTDPYELGKYGRIAVDYTDITTFDGSDIGVAAQALHVAHHLLFYSMGVSSDINNDGMFLLTAGLAHYQTGNSRAEPFVDAPFVRFRFQSSAQNIFAYSEVETTMHFRQYFSGMVGMGLRVTPTVRLMGGIHHTEFVMPTEQIVRYVDGLEGIISWGM